MRFLDITDVLPAVGTVRRERAFLFTPMRIGDETRWLEVAEWEETFWYHNDLIPGTREEWGWKATCWL
jgi:hypothetical protein